MLDDPLELEAFTRWQDSSGTAEAAAEGRRIAESSLRLGGLHCAACAGTIEQALRRVSGVLDVTLSADAAIATIRWVAAATRASALVQAVEQAGGSAVPDTSLAARAQRRVESPGSRRLSSSQGVSTAMQPCLRAERARTTATTWIMESLRWMPVSRAGGGRG